jgi:hypothetical protein
MAQTAAHLVDHVIPHVPVRQRVLSLPIPLRLLPAAQPAEREANRAHHRPVRLSWARLLKRVFEIDLQHCANCGGGLKIIAAILEQPVIEKLLAHLDPQARAPPRAAARGQALQAAGAPSRPHRVSAPALRAAGGRLRLAGPTRCGAPAL